MRGNISEFDTFFKNRSETFKNIIIKTLHQKLNKSVHFLSYFSSISSIFALSKPEILFFSSDGNLNTTLM